MDTAGSTNAGETPQTGRGGRARTGLAGAVLGVGAAVGALVLVTTGAGAQQATLASTDAGAAPAEAAVVVEADHGDDGYGFDLDEEAFEAHIACIEEVLGPIDEGEAEGDDGEVIEFDLSEEEWEAIEGDLEACDELLPAEVLEQFEIEDAAFEAYDQCLVDEGLIEEGELDGDDLDIDIDIFDDAESIVFLETDDGATTVYFGDGDGELSVVQRDGDVTVATDGDVVVESFDWDELEAMEGAWEICDEHLPEDLFGDEYFEGDEYDDHDDEDGDED